MAYAFNDDKSKAKLNDVIKVEVVSLYLSGSDHQIINAGYTGALRFEFTKNTDLYDYYVIGVKDISVWKQNNTLVDFLTDLVVKFFPSVKLEDRYFVTVKNVTSNDIHIYRQSNNSYYSQIELLVLEVLK